MLVRDYTGGRPGTNLGSYILHFVRAPGPYTHGDDGGALTNGGNHPGRIGAPGANPRLHLGDLDVWTFQAAQNESIALSIGEVLDSGIDPDFRPWIRLYGPTGAYITQDSGFLTASINVAAPLSGTYTVVVGDWIGGREGSHVGDYILHFVRAPGPYTHGDDGGALTNGGNHPGRIGAPGANPRLQLGDLDVWTFQAAQNESIALSIGEVLDSEVDPDFRPWIRLYGPTGAYITQDAGFLTASINVAAPLSGTYTVVVGDWIGGREGSHVGDYILHFVKAPGPYTVPTGDDGGPITHGANFPGRIGAPGANPRLQRGDLDVYTFCAVQGVALTINVSEINIPTPDPDFQPWIHLYRPDGRYLTQSAGVVNTSINVNAPLSGQYTVIVADWIGGREGSHVGDYVLSAFGLTACPSPPTTTADAYSTAMNTTLTLPAPGVLANDNSNGGGALSAQLARTVSDGTLTLNANGGFTFTPPAAFAGTTSFTYRALNAAGAGNEATVTITVTAGTPPTTIPDNYDVTTGTTLNEAAPGVLGNDSSNGHGALTAELVTPTTSGIVALNTDGSFAYTPNAGFVGADSFTYRAVSSVGPGTEARVSIRVTDTGPQPPTELYAAFISGNTVTLRFKAPASGAAPTGYVLEGGVAPGEVLASIATGNTNPIYTLVAPTGSFYVRMHTLAGGVKSVASNEILIHVNVAVPPSAPANLTGMANGNTIALAWRNTFAGGAAGGVVLDVSGSLNASLPLGLTDNFQFVGVPAGSYTLSVRALNAAGSSPASNAVTMAFPSPTCVSPPQPPANFLAYRIGNAINVLWDPAATGGAPTGFTLGVTGAFNGSFATPGRTLSGVVGPGSYTLSVSAANPCGASATTATQTVIVP